MSFPDSLYPLYVTNPLEKKQEPLPVDQWLIDMNNKLQALLILSKLEAIV